ncbi:MAG TPA: tetratricopeptide repeat protein [Chthoniobacterales bacterium]|nr:tetratricopeptide repeat protein [Chthoniobacterales bacterium]
MSVSSSQAREGGKWFEKESWLLGIVLLLTALAFANSLTGEFLYDDWYQIERNPQIKSWTFLPSVFSHHVWAFSATENMPVSGLYYRPIFNLALLIIYQLAGSSVIGWHLVSLLLHLGATALVYRLGRLWNFEKVAAALAALIFGLHPVHVEVVAWASALPDLMLGLFGLGCLVLYEKFRRAERHRGLWFLGSLLCALLAMGAKETGLILPLFVIVREVLDSGAEKETLGRIKTLGLRTGPFVLVAIGALSARYSVLGFFARNNAHSIWHLILTVPFVLLHYLRTLVAPYPLAFIYDYEFILSATDPRFWASALFLLALAIFVIRFWISHPQALKALALFVVFLLPALNLRALTPIESIVHDRYLYLPSAGFLIFAAFLLHRLANRLSERPATFLVNAGVVFALILTPITWLQNSTWQSDTVLTEHALRFSPRWPFLHLHLAEVYEEKGRVAEAEDELKKALALGPRWTAAYETLGNFYSKRGRASEAERLFLEATRRGTDVLSTRVNLAVNQIRLGKLAEAKTKLEQVVAEHPDNAAANFNLGLVHEKQEHLDLAEQHYRKAIAKDPTYVDPRVNLAAVLVRQMRFDDAYKQIDAVRSLAPQNTEIVFSLAGAYLQSQKCDLAVETLNQLTQANPNQPRAFVMLGLAYECLGQPENARSSFQRAVDVAPQDPIIAVARRHLEQLAAPK